MAEEGALPRVWAPGVLERRGASEGGLAELHTVPVLLWTSRPDGRCTFFNRTWLAFTGRSLEEGWGVGWAQKVHHDDLETCMATYREAFDGRRGFDVEYRLRRPDGSCRWILERGLPRQAPDGNFAGYVGSCIDITERRNLEAELRAAVEARDDFLSVASHELATPLTALQLNLQQLRRLMERRNTAPDDPVSQRISAIDDQVGRLVHLTENLLDTTRLTAGKWELERTRVELNELVHRVVRRLAPVAERARCPITVRNEAPVVGSWDAGRLEQAVTNLLSNAFKYGAGKPVEVTVAANGATARLRVVDQGIGIEPGRETVIFERFGRAVPGQHYGGLGLGLWIARQGVEAMGGAIRMESVLGAGATFEIILPTTG